MRAVGIRPLCRLQVRNEGHECSRKWAFLGSRCAGGCSRRESRQREEGHVADEQERRGTDYGEPELGRIGRERRRAGRGGTVDAQVIRVQVLASIGRVAELEVEVLHAGTKKSNFFVFRAQFLL